MRKPPQHGFPDEVIFNGPRHGNSSDHHSEESRQLHIPVLREAALQQLAPKKGETYLDLTAGYGGHARAIAEMIGRKASMTLVDRDAMAIRTLDDLKESGARIIHSDFLSAAKSLVEQGEQFDIILADLGVSSPQLDMAERGFSFRSPGPLDMRMDQKQSLTAEIIVNGYPESQLAQIIRDYGEEPRSKRIAHAIVMGRPLRTTSELADVIAGALGSRRQKIHPATRTFQALRIALNQELAQVQGLLPLLPQLLRPGGRVAIISFHSLEDRLVKRYFADQAASGYEAELQILTKKPIDGATADVHNPRARSAKLRAAVKIKK